MAPPQGSELDPDGKLRLTKQPERLTDIEALQLIWLMKERMTKDKDLSTKVCYAIECSACQI